jgi:hypothetical protein
LKNLIFHLSYIEIPGPFTFSEPAKPDHSKPGGKNVDIQDLVRIYVLFRSNEVVIVIKVRK